VFCILATTENLVNDVQTNGCVLARLCLVLQAMPNEKAVRDSIKGRKAINCIGKRKRRSCVKLAVILRTRLERAVPAR